MDAKKIITDLVNNLIDKKEDLEIEIIENNTDIFANIKVDDSDIGKIIGKNGRLIQAIRNYLQAVIVKHLHKRIIVEVNKKQKNI